MMIKNSGAIYYCIHKKLVDKYGCNKEFDKKDLMVYLGRVLHIPKNWNKIIYKELKCIKIIEEFNEKNPRTTIKINLLPIDINPEDNHLVNKIVLI